MRFLKSPSLVAVLAALAITLLSFGPVAYAATVTGRITVQTSFDYVSALDLVTANVPLQRSVPITFTSGTGSGQVNEIWTDERAISSSSSESLDLAGSLTNAVGGTITFATVKAIIIESATANTVDITVGNAASNGFTGPFGGATHTVAVRPGGVAMFVAPKTGWTVTASTGDLLKVAAGAADITYRITIIGTV